MNRDIDPTEQAKAYVLDRQRWTRLGTFEFYWAGLCIVLSFAISIMLFVVMDERVSTETIKDYKWFNGFYMATVIVLLGMWVASFGLRWGFWGKKSPGASTAPPDSSISFPSVDA